MCNRICGILLSMAFGILTPCVQADEAELQAEITKLRSRVAELEKALADCHHDKSADAKKPPAQPPVGHDGDRFIRTSSVDGKTLAEFDPKSLNWVAGARHDHRLGMVWSRDQNAEQLTFTVKTYASGRKYHDLPSVSLIMDDQTIELPVLDYDSQLRRISIGGRRVRADDESFRLELDPALLKRFAEARSIRIQMREVIYAFSDVHLIGLSAMARLRP